MFLSQLFLTSGNIPFFKQREALSAEREPHREREGKRESEGERETHKEREGVCVSI